MTSRGNPRELDKVSESSRLLELAATFGRHGLAGLATLISLPLWKDEASYAGAPERLVGLVNLGPIAIKVGQVLGTRDDLLGLHWIAALIQAARPRH